MRTHHTKNKGDLGVLKAQLDLFEKGYLTLIPQTEHSPFDIVAYRDGKFLRVQVKYRSSVNNKITVRFSTCWSDKNGTHTQRYDKNEIDVICIYSPDTDKCYYVDPKQCGETFDIRLSLPKNGQKRGINMADKFLKIPDTVISQA